MRILAFLGHLIKVSVLNNLEKKKILLQLYLVGLEHIYLLGLSVYYKN